jgi:AAA+ superfamily predicted ATPase
MPSIFGGVAEVLLWPWGIKRKRKLPPREALGDGEAGVPEDDVTWEVDTVHFLSAVTGAALAWWALSKLKATPLALAQSAPAPATDTTSAPRIALSEFLQLLRGGAVSAVTYVADQLPAGSLLVKTLPIAIAAAKPLLADRAAGTPSTAFATRGCGVAALATGRSPLVETLLLPGCHQGLFEELQARAILFECAEVAAENETDYGSSLSLLIDVGGLIASVAALLYLFRGQVGSSFTGKHLEEKEPDSADRRPQVTFEDVAGMESTKEELREVISYLRDPQSFYALGAHPPCGILLAGPSGTGKTLLARAVAGESGVTFLYASSASFVEIYVGQGAQRIRQFYEQARSCAPCIVFLDEIDALGASRQYTSSGGNQEYAQTLNQLLLELDGVESHSHPDGSQTGAASPCVITMAATNRYDCLDEALVRPGRLDRIVMVALPNQFERRATLEIHARRLRTEGLDFDDISKRTAGSSGADLANLLNEAALLAARRRAEAVRMEHVDAVLRQPRPQQNKGAGAGDGSETWRPSQNGAFDMTNAMNMVELLAQTFAAAGATSAPPPC